MFFIEWYGVMSSIGALYNEVQDFSVISFSDYKINFNKCLGDGMVGTVYEVVRRPMHENGQIASVCPYLYDRIHPVDEARKIETDLCVKISKTTFRLFFYNPFAVLRNPLILFYEAKEERNLNRMLQRLGATSIKFYHAGDCHAQFKTRVYGHNFAYHLRKRSFLDPAQFEFRKAFVGLLRTVSRPEFNVDDLHANNLMYDERKKLWEVVDGKLSGFTHEGDSKESKIFSFLFWACMLPPKDDRIPESCERSLQMLFGELTKAAVDEADYTIEIDREMFAGPGKGIQQRQKDNVELFDPLDPLDPTDFEFVFEELGLLDKTE